MKNLSTEQKREFLAGYYERQNKHLTEAGYKQHYRQLTQLMREGRTIADGKKIVLTDDMLESLFWQYEVSEQVMKNIRSKGGKASKGGGAPKKNPSEWSPSYRAKMESKQRQTEHKANEKDR